jgi:purine-binding chemotaxis protein CheW
MIGAMPTGEAQGNSGLCLIARARAAHCAMPLAHVVEIMRPLPIDPIAKAPSFMLGVAVVRGRATPVIDCGAFLQERALAAHTRWASVRCGDRSAVLAFEAILGVRELPVHGDDLPPLLSGAPSELLSGLALLDRSLLLVLHGSRLVPDEVWQTFESRDEVGGADRARSKA